VGLVAAKMKNLTKVILVIILAVIIFVLVYQQTEINNLKSPQASPSPQLTPQESQSPFTTLTPTPSYTQTPFPTPTPTPEVTIAPTSTAPTSTPLHLGSLSAISADIFVLPIGGNELSYLLISGNVTNNSPNILYNVGLHVYSYGYPFIGPNEETLINTTVPVSSGSYGGFGNYTLSTLSPNESLSINVQVHSAYEYRTPRLYGNEVTITWTK
jgi:hypothetical protein